MSLWIEDKCGSDCQKLEKTIYLHKDLKHLPKLPHEADSGPFSRTRQVQTSTTNEASPNNNETSEMFPFCENDGDVEDAQDIEAAEALLALLNSQNIAEVVLPGPSYRDSAVQVNSPKVLTLCELISSDEKLKTLLA
ncbi:hypothetical protein JTB14_013271 [Gonioctena quinquepunctata]|nr:hypothetical protein JTB14_013271 [Gonioctena quinquepunctata]